MVHLTWPWELQFAHRASNWSQLNWVKQADTTAMMHNCLHFVNEHMAVTSVFEWNLILCRSTSTQSCVNETIMSWEQHTLEILICRTPLNLSKRLYCDVRRAVVSCVVCPIWSQRHLSAETSYLPSEIREHWWTLLWYLKLWRNFLKWKSGNFIYTKKCDEVSLFTHGSPVFSLTLARSPMASRSYRRASDFLNYSPGLASDILAERKSGKIFLPHFF